MTGAEASKLLANKDQVEKLMVELEQTIKEATGRKLTRVQMRQEVASHATAEVANQRKAIRAEAQQTTLAARKLVQACGGLHDTFREDATNLMASAKCFLVMVGTLIQQTTFATLGARLQQQAAQFQQTLIRLVTQLRDVDAARREEGMGAGSVSLETLTPFVESLKVVLWSRLRCVR